MKLEYNSKKQLVSKIDGNEVWWSIGIEVAENVVSVYGEDEKGNEYFGHANADIAGNFEVIKYELLID